MEKSIKELEAEIQRLNREFSILNSISQTVNQSVDLHETLNNSLDRIKELTEVNSVCLHIFEEDEQCLILTVQRGFSKAYEKGFRRLKLGEGITGKTATSGEASFIEDYPDHPEALALAIEEGVKTLVVIPLKSKANIYGTLNIAWRESHRFNSFEKNLYNSIGQIISGALERASLYTENVKRLEEQKSLYSISQEIASRLELKVILQKIIESAVDLLGSEAGSITLWDQQKQNYATALVHGLPESLLGREFSTSPKGIGWEIIKKKAPVLYRDYDHHPDRLRELDSYHFKEVLGVPLIVREMIIGTMVVSTSDPKRHFRDSDINLLMNFVNHAAIAIGNARLYEDSLAKIRQLTILYEIGSCLLSTLDPDALFNKVLELLRDRWGYAACAILLIDRIKEELYIKQVTGRNFEDVEPLRFRVGVDGIVGRVAKTGEPYYAPDVSKDPYYLSGPEEVKSEAAFPLKARDRVIGVLNIESRELMGFDREDLRVLSLFASQVSLSIENAQLFSDLKRALQELKQAQDQIIQAEKLRALGEMASGVAHDFNNLLAVILGNIQLLLYQLEHLGQEEIGERLKAVERASKDGAEIVRRIQEFTGVRRDQEFTPVSINEIIEEVMAITQPRWKDQPQKKGIQIELVIRFEDACLILGNPSELREVFTNLIFNAVDAMPDGGRIEIATHREETRVEARVTDTGIGMTDEVKKRVFDPFFTTKGVTSSGLGMSVSYGIVKRHGGEILVESESGRGTTFVIHLPIGQEKGDSRPERGEPAKETLLAQILVIDDEDPIRDILCRILKSKGHHVATACDGEEGIERFKRDNFDIVFTDLGMPKVSGWEVGKAIKKLNPKVPIAMITGWGIELNKEKLIESGIDLVVSKPFNLEQVNQIVSEAMALRERM